MKPEDCLCGAKYDDLRTGLTFGEVKRMMFVRSDDSRDWVYRRRHCILGFWHGLKLSLWFGVHSQCEHHYHLTGREPST